MEDFGDETISSEFSFLDVLICFPWRSLAFLQEISVKNSRTKFGSAICYFSSDCLKATAKQTITMWTNFILPLEVRQQHHGIQ